jgi:hypothetical protein
MHVFLSARASLSACAGPADKPQFLGKLTDRGLRKDARADPRGGGRDGSCRPRRQLRARCIARREATGTTGGTSTTGRKFVPRSNGIKPGVLVPPRERRRGTGDGAPSKNLGHAVRRSRSSAQPNPERSSGRMY